MNGGHVIFTENCDSALNLKCVPSDRSNGDGLDPLKVIKIMNFEFVTGCAMAYVCPKSYAKNLSVFFNPITKIVLIF